MASALLELTGASSKQADSSADYMSQAQAAMGGQHQVREGDPGPSIGGALGAGMGGALTGATLGSMMAAEGLSGIAAVGGPITLGIGAGIGILSYLLS